MPALLRVAVIGGQHRFEAIKEAYADGVNEGALGFRQPRQPHSAGGAHLVPRRVRERIADGSTERILKLTTCRPFNNRLPSHRGGQYLFHRPQVDRLVVHGHDVFLFRLCAILPRLLRLGPSGLWHANLNWLGDAACPVEIPYSLDGSSVQYTALPQNHEVAITCHYVVIGDHRDPEVAYRQPFYPEFGKGRRVILQRIEHFPRKAMWSGLQSFQSGFEGNASEHPSVEFHGAAQNAGTQIRNVCRQRIADRRLLTADHLRYDLQPVNFRQQL